MIVSKLKPIVVSISIMEVTGYSY